MHHFFVLPKMIKGTKATIIGEDVQHIRRVLRLTTGDEISLSDGKGAIFRARIESINHKSIVAAILKEEKHQEQLPFVTLFQALPKGTKMDLIIRQATELGIKEIVPLVTERSLVHLDKKSAEKRIIRWRRIAEEASKQSRRAYLPDFSDIMKWEEALESLRSYGLIIVPWEEEKAAGIRKILRETGGKKQVAAVIGPEGGFTSLEIETLKGAGARIVSLGENILRTETAAIAAIAIILYELAE